MSAELRHIDFHGKPVPVLLQEDGELFVPMRPRVETLGLSWGSQAAKFRSNPRKWGVSMIDTVAADGRCREVLCLPLRKLDVWLLNLEPSRVKPEFREELEREQDELSEVLWAYRMTGAAIRPEVRAAAPEATRALFDEIEALTGLDPEPAQPGANRPLAPWQVRCMEARATVLGFLLELAQEMGVERAIARLVDDADAQRLPEAVQAAIPLANARAGTSGERTVSRRTLQRWMANERDGLDLAPMAPERPEPDWAAPFLDHFHRSGSIAQALRQLQGQLPPGSTPPSYDAARRMARKDTAPVSRVVGALTGELIQQLRSLFGDEGARQSLRRMFPAYFLEGGAR